MLRAALALSRAGRLAHKIMQIFDAKPATEVRTLTFTFPGIPSAPSIQAFWYGGALDASPSSVLTGGFTISGNSVLHQVQAGVPGVDYLLDCRALVGNDTVQILAVLPVSGVS